MKEATLSWSTRASADGMTRAIVASSSIPACDARVGGVELLGVMLQAAEQERAARA